MTTIIGLYLIGMLLTIGFVGEDWEGEHPFWILLCVLFWPMAIGHALRAAFDKYTREDEPPKEKRPGD